MMKLRAFDLIWLHSVNTGYNLACSSIYHDDFPIHMGLKAIFKQEARVVVDC